MHHVGIDLAWGERKPTGLAVLDAGGRLLHVSACTTDETVLAALAPYADGDLLVAIDAPLVVTNPTGNRPAEKALNKDFARFDAGAHPSNTGKPEFALEPRGARVARALGLDLDPASTGPRRALEVYPHAATVALFRLGRTLKYKDKPGRSLEQMRAELLRLTALLAGLEQAEPALHLAGNADWDALVSSVATAARKSELRRAEDQVDAVVCAYTALFVHHRPGDVTVYGDAATGAIVTPTLPAGHEPTPRGAGAEEDAEPEADPVRDAVREYAAQLPRVREATERWLTTLTGLLDDAGINYLSVTGRAKSVASFAGKAAREADGVRLHPDPLRDVTDHVGLRVITYVRGDVAAVAELLADEFTVLDDRDLGLETARAGRFGYASRHLLVTDAPPGTDLDDVLGDPAGRVSVQVRTVLQHAWAEFEHDVRYKGTVPAEHAPDLDRRFTLAAGLLELADAEFSAIRAALREAVPEPSSGGSRIPETELAGYLGKRYRGSGWSRTDHYAWVSDLLAELGITSVPELSGLLGTLDEAALAARMDYKYPPGAVRRLDDALLAVFGQRYVGLRGNAHRADRLLERLEKLRAEG